MADRVRKSGGSPGRALKSPGEREGSRIVPIMKDAAEAVGTVVRAVGTWSEAANYAVQTALSGAHGTLAEAGLPEPGRQALDQAAETAGLQLLSPNGIDVPAIVVTSADYGIAETGTVVLDSTDESVRIATMLTEIHIVVLPTDRIRADFFHLAEELSTMQKAGPRYIAFLSGASRTADIERVLTIGVHGPEELHLLLLEKDDPSP